MENQTKFTHGRVALEIINRDTFGVLTQSLASCGRSLVQGGEKMRGGGVGRLQRLDTRKKKGGEKHKDDSYPQREEEKTKKDEKVSFFSPLKAHFRRLVWLSLSAVIHFLELSG